MCGTPICVALSIILVKGGNFSMFDLEVIQKYSDYITIL